MRIIAVLCCSLFLVYCFYLSIFLSGSYVPTAFDDLLLQLYHDLMFKILRFYSSFYSSLYFILLFSRNPLPFRNIPKCSSLYHPGAAFDIRPFSVMPSMLVCFYLYRVILPCAFHFLCAADQQKNRMDRVLVCSARRPLT